MHQNGTMIENYRGGGLSQRSENKSIHQNWKINKEKNWQGTVLEPAEKY